MTRRVRLPGLLLALAFMTQAAAADLGRLFTTPQQRQALEGIRYAAPEPPPVVAETPAPEPPQLEVETAPALEHPITLKGLVYREQGGNMAWLNDGNTLESELAARLQIDPSSIRQEKLKLVLPDTGEEITLKVGQTYDPANNSIIDIARESGPTGEPPVATPRARE
jgi:hypothetical protein